MEVGFAGISGGWFAEVDLRKEDREVNPPLERTHGWVDLRKEDRDSMVQYLYPSGVTSCEEQSASGFSLGMWQSGFQQLKPLNLAYLINSRNR